MSSVMKALILAMTSLLMGTLPSAGEEKPGERPGGQNVNFVSDVLGVEEGKLPRLMEIRITPQFSEGPVNGYFAKLTNLSCSMYGPAERPTYRPCIYKLTTDTYVDEQVASLSKAIGSLNANVVAHAAVQKIKGEYEERLATMKTEIDRLERRLSELENTAKAAAARR
jgi:hypothetical protein